MGPVRPLVEEEDRLRRAEALIEYHDGLARLRKAHLHADDREREILGKYLRALDEKTRKTRAPAGNRGAKPGRRQVQGG